MDEVHVLKSSVATLQENLQHGDSDDTSDSDQGVKERKGRGRQPRVPNSVADTNHTKPPSQVGKGNKPSFPVENAKKIWGTMKSATPAIVSNAIK